MPLVVYTPWAKIKASPYPYSYFFPLPTALYGVSCPLLLHLRGFLWFKKDAYSYFFAANFPAIFGPVIYVRFLLNFNKKALAAGCFAIAAASGIFLILLGSCPPFFS